MIEFEQIDAFTNRPFSGNPAAVIETKKELSVSVMQDIAKEMNLSETAFLVKLGENQYSLRWFTPTDEVDLCGHATLASSSFLFEKNKVEGDEVFFHTQKSGKLSAKMLNSGKIELNFPIRRAAIDNSYVEKIKSLGLSCIESWVYNEYVIGVIENSQELRSYIPNQEIIKKDFKGHLNITAKGEGDYDFISRYFAPGYSIDEDPVTGSAHCFLAPIWQSKLNKNEMVAYQASNRGGSVEVKVGGERVLLRGDTVHMLSGQLLIDL